MLILTKSSIGINFANDRNKTTLNFLPLNIKKLTVFSLINKMINTICLGQNFDQFVVKKNSLICLGVKKKHKT